MTDTSKKLAKLIYPSEKQIDKILDKWSDEHGNAWDYDADRRCAENVIKRYKKLMQKLNNS